MDILDFLIDNFEFGTDIREILYNINLDYVCFIERKIKALYNKIIKINRVLKIIKQYETQNSFQP